MSLIPLIRALRLSGRESEKFLTTHLQMFNTHPYFSAPIIGSIARLEEGKARGEGEAAIDTASIRQSLMASYAAIGDIFFWGALRPFASILTVCLIYLGAIIAPLAFLLVYNPAHLWVRLKGFTEGYTMGKRGFEFIRSLKLPVIAVKIRRACLVVLIGLMVWLSRNDGYWPFAETMDVIVKLTALAAVVMCLLLIKKGLSQTYIIYGAFFLFILVSWGGLLH